MVENEMPAFVRESAHVLDRTGDQIGLVQISRQITAAVDQDARSSTIPGILSRVDAPDLEAIGDGTSGQSWADRRANQFLLGLGPQGGEDLGDVTAQCAL